MQFKAKVKVKANDKVQVERCKLEVGITPKGQLTQPLSRFIHLGACPSALARTLKYSCTYVEGSVCRPGWRVWRVGFVSFQGRGIASGTRFSLQGRINDH